MPRKFMRDENAVNIELGYILNLIVIMIFIASFTGAFYLRADASSQQAQRAEFTDMGSEIARDITNMYLSSAHSSNYNNISFTMTRDIPLTLGGKGYIIELEDSNSYGMASVILKEGSYEIGSRLNAIDTQVKTDGIVYSGSGEITITMKKNSTETWVWIK
jgi:hypothetical protein